MHTFWDSWKYSIIKLYAIVYSRSLTFFSKKSHFGSYPWVFVFPVFKTFFSFVNNFSKSVELVVCALNPGSQYNITQFLQILDEYSNTTLVYSRRVTQLTDCTNTTLGILKIILNQVLIIIIIIHITTFVVVATCAHVCIVSINKVHSSHTH